MVPLFCAVALSLPSIVLAIPLSDSTAVGEALTRIFRGLQPSLVQVIAYRPAGVSAISAEGMGKLSREDPSRSTLWATGVVLDARGLIMTCAEAAQPGDSLQVRLFDGRRLGARFLAQDVVLGASLIQAEGASGLVPVNQGAGGRCRAAREGDDRCRAGEWMLVLNFAAGDGRPDLRLGTFDGITAASSAPQPFLKVALPDCHGTCGGALVDCRGRFRGMVLDIPAERDGDTGAPDSADLLECDGVRALSFPALVKLAGNLEASSRRPVGFLGVKAEVGDPFSTPAEVSAATPARPLRVVSVLPGSPAQAAGILPGDEILEIDGRAVRDVAGITDRIAAAPPGTEIQVKCLRRGVPIVVTARIGDRSALEWNARQDDMNQVRQKRIRRSIEQLQARLRQLEQERSRFQ